MESMLDINNIRGVEMTKNIKKPKIFFSLVTVIILGLAIFNSTYSFSKVEANKESNYEVTDLTISNDIFIVEDINNMVLNSDIVVEGYFNQKVDTINMLRDPADVTKESSIGYEEGYIYDFKISEVLAGDIDKKNINVGFRYSYLYEYLDKDGGKVDIQIPNSLFIEPKQKQKYILFLYENPELDTYFVPFEPYRIEVSEDNLVSIDSALMDKDSETVVNNVKLEKTKEELRIIDDTHGEITDTITGKPLSEIKKEIKESSRKKE